MKISSTIIFLFFASAISAQTGNIGVNTTTPQKTLHVNGSLQVTNEINVGAIPLQQEVPVQQDRFLPLAELERLPPGQQFLEQVLQPTHLPILPILLPVQ